MTVVFVYGTLTDRTRVSKLLTEYTLGPSAVCHGLQRVDGRYPTLVPGGRVSGRLLSTTELDRLDRYEGVDRGLYCRVRVPLRSAHTSEATERSESDRAVFDVGTAEVYIGNPPALGLSTQIDWPDADSFNQSVAEYVNTNLVQIVIKDVHR